MFKGTPGRGLIFRTAKQSTADPCPFTLVWNMSKGTPGGDTSWFQNRRRKSANIFIFWLRNASPMTYQHFCKRSTFVSNHSCPWGFALFLMKSRKGLAHDVMYTAVLHAALVYDLWQSWLKWLCSSCPCFPGFQASILKDFNHNSTEKLQWVYVLLHSCR